MVVTLISFGAALNPKNSNGRTPLEEAKYADHCDIVAELERAGSRRTIFDVFICRASSRERVCDRPAFNLRSGIYHTPISITLTCPVKEASIFYCLDDAIPTPETGCLYDGRPIRLECMGGTVTIRAVAVGPKRMDSYAVKATYRLVALPSPAFDPPPGLYDQVINVGVSASASPCAKCTIV